MRLGTSVLGLEYSVLRSDPAASGGALFVVVAVGIRHLGALRVGYGALSIEIGAIDHRPQTTYHLTRGFPTVSAFHFKPVDSLRAELVLSGPVTAT